MLPPFRIYFGFKVKVSGFRSITNNPITYNLLKNYLFSASATFTAHATVHPTIGLLPMPRKPIISTCAGTEEEPANCASECIRPRVSVIPYEAGPAAILSGCSVRPVPPPDATEKYGLPAERRLRHSSLPLHVGRQNMTLS